MIVARVSIVVTIWWLIAITAAHLMPAPVESAAKIGGLASVQIPGLSELPIPVERTAFDLAQRGFREADEDAIETAFSEYEWISVSHRQVVRVLSIDGPAVEVELLEGQHAGRRGWLLMRQLTF